MPDTSAQYYKRDFWIQENLKYAQPHFRLEKAARIVNRIANGKKCDLLDVGCGPATLRYLLDRNIQYHGIDIALHEQASDLLQVDFLENPISFKGKKFDIILAQGVFEYVGAFQAQKFSEITQLLKENGTFVVSYVNFDHRKRQIYWPYSNIQSFGDFYKSLGQFFHVDRFFPTSHHWQHREPSR
ncbi:MAG TPA: class I SAM-dependent methyltransferase, partial [Terriglobia bacterium]|nr:class I SAM-dependent methyltransferase [Terriglobia bacterium]